MARSVKDDSEPMDQSNFSRMAESMVDSRMAESFNMTDKKHGA
ncbi:hypothetical protein SLEP1_g32214 [Rubroshorea leprosula]|uniref:Uncharacterized protein n=1 Tax=Rubroshorea leprosula TaxID=152421 RepID=A0AAV5KCN1_9ROSI|nr:hypothetical protein SLEP1_g32214 [Rubroshorea leprosula]